MVEQRIAYHQLDGGENTDINKGKERKLIFKLLANQIKHLKDQFSEDHISYDIKFGDVKYILPRDNDEFLRVLFKDALSVLVDELIDKKVDPIAWDRIEALEFGHKPKDWCTSPISVEEYGEIKIVAAEKSKPINLDSLYVNVQRFDWNEDKQKEFILRKEEIASKGDNND